MSVIADEGLHVMTRRENGEYSETMLVEGQQYSRSLPDGPWEVTPTGFNSARMQTLDSSRRIQVVDGLVDSAILGEETLHGVQVTKVTGRVDLLAKARAFWGEGQSQDPPLNEGSEMAQIRDQMLEGVEEFVGWIGVEDGLFHAFEVTASFPRVGELLPYQYWYRVEFSSFDEPLELPSVESAATESTRDGLAPTPTPVSHAASRGTSHQGTATHPHDKLPLCDDIERLQWPEGVPTPAPSGPPTFGTEGQPGNVRCRATPTVTDTPRPGRSGPDNSDGLGGPRPYYRPTLDVDYDDSWVANIPATIGGYSVRFINTPKSKVCNHVPLISVKALAQSDDGSTTPPLDVTSLRKEIQSIPGVPEKINLSFSQGKFDPDAKAKMDRERNAHRLEHGCPRWGGPIPE